MGEMKDRRAGRLKGRGTKVEQVSKADNVLSLETSNRNGEVDSPGRVKDGSKSRLDSIVNVLAETEVGKTEIRRESCELGRMIVLGESLLAQ